MRILWAVFATLPLCAYAQHAATEKPVALLAGLGIYTKPIAATSTEAQKFFDQGLTLLYGFNRYEAVRSFEKAAQLDPRSAFARVGLAWALGPHINMDGDGDYRPAESCAAASAAQPLARNAWERAWSAAILARCPALDESRFIAATRALAAAYPNDPDAQTLFAEALILPARWRWFTRDGQPAPGVAEAIAVLEAVLRRHPNHPGANHLYLHAVEMSPSPERAVPSAQRLMGIVPNAGHLVHMPGHIWLRLGDWELAATLNERAAALDRNYFAHTGATSAYFGYMIHNITFVAYARQMQGRPLESLQAAREVQSAAAAFLTASPPAADYGFAYPYFTLVRFSNWSDALKEPAPDPRLPVSTALWRWMRALAYHATARPADAAIEVRAFHAGRASVPKDWMWINNRAQLILDIAAASLDARLASSPRAALPHWRRAVELQDTLVYDEPPAWFYPIRESLGAALLASGDAAAAEVVFRTALRESPNNGRLLFGLLESLKAQKNDIAAAMVRSEFDTAWKRAAYTLSLAGLE